MHDKGAAVNAFLRYAVPMGKNYANVTFIHSDQRFEIPNDVAGGEPAATDDSETQTDSFVAVQMHQPLASGGALSYGIGYKQSRIQDFGDPKTISSTATPERGQAVARRRTAPRALCRRARIRWPPTERLATASST